MVVSRRRYSQPRSRSASGAAEAGRPALDCCYCPYNASDALGGFAAAHLRGTTSGRVAASLLGAIGMPELVTESLDDYEALAIRLARNTDALNGLKQKLARNRLTCPLFDTDLFRKNIETAYAVMWAAWKKGEPPKSFAGAP